MVYIDLTGHSGTSALGVAKANPDFGAPGPGLVALTSLLWDKAKETHNFAVNTFGSVMYRLGAGESFRSQYEATGDAVIPARESAYNTFRDPQHFVTAVVESNIERKQRYDAAIERGDIKAAQAEAIPFLLQVSGAASGASAPFSATPGGALATSEGYIFQTGAVAARTGGTAPGLFMASQGGAEPSTVQENTPTKRNPSTTKPAPAKASESPTSAASTDAPAAPKSAPDYGSGRGRRGSPATRAHIDAERDTFLDANPEYRHVGGGTDRVTGAKVPEEYIPGPGGGRQGSSFPDLTFEGPDASRVRLNTVDTDAAGNMSVREQNNFDRIFEQTEEPVIAIPKPKKPKPQP